MTITPLKKAFSGKLRKLIKESLCRQCQIAEVLQITNSAVSQMLSGKIVPHHEQLEVMCRMAYATRQQQDELFSMLARIRTGECNLLSPFNHLFSAACCERGVDLGTLSNLSGVALGRLQLFENSFHIVPTFDEIKKIAPVIGCSVEDMLLAAGLMKSGAPAGEPNTLGEPELVFEPLKRMLPLIPLDEFKNFDATNQSLFDFAGSVAKEQTSYGSDSELPAVAVMCSGEALGMGRTVSVMVIIGTKRPSSIRAVDFVRDAGGNFYLRERDRGIWNLYHFCGDIPVGVRHVRWTFPVYELIIRPMRYVAGSGEWGK